MVLQNDQQLSAVLFVTQQMKKATGINNASCRKKINGTSKVTVQAIVEQ